MTFAYKLLQQSFISALISIFVITSAVQAQSYPKKIRGYKIYQTKISINPNSENSSGKKDTEAIVKLGDLELTDISLSGITLEISADIESIEQSGKIDFVTFQDFKVNGLDVKIEEYKESFEIKHGEKTLLPKPVKIFISASQTLRGALKELKESKKDWTISGKLFVFGTFKKYGFKFKRVVPLDIIFKIENPVKKKLAQNDQSTEK
ncbi:MAG: hypothetical protein ABIP06_14490 [Pyrinomonadaceae bacterium]